MKISSDLSPNEKSLSPLFKCFTLRVSMNSSNLFLALRRFMKSSLASSDSLTNFLSFLFVDDDDVSIDDDHFANLFTCSYEQLDHLIQTMIRIPFFLLYIQVCYTTAVQRANLFQNIICHHWGIIGNHETENGLTHKTHKHYIIDS